MIQRLKSSLSAPLRWLKNASIMTVVECNGCKRILYGKASRERGYGPTCFKREQQVAVDTQQMTIEDWGKNEEAKLKGS